MDSSNDFLLGQEGSNGAYGPGEQVWLICPGQEHKTADIGEAPGYLRRMKNLDYSFLS